MPKSFAASALRNGLLEPSDLREGHSILWVYRGDVEAGSVILVDAVRRMVTVVWLDGYKSRTDDVSFGDVVGVYSAQGKQVEVGHFSGKAFFTAAGRTKYAPASA